MGQTGTGKKWSTSFTKHQYFKGPWVLTFAGGADFEERRPKTTGTRPVPEWHGINRIAVSREARALIRFIRGNRGLDAFVSRQAWLADAMGKVPAGVEPVAFVRSRLDYLLYLAHRTQAHAAKRRLSEFLKRPRRYSLPVLPKPPENVVPVRRTKRVPTFETVAQYLARNGSIKVYSVPCVLVDKNGWARGEARIISEIVTGQVQMAA